MDYDEIHEAVKILAGHYSVTVFVDIGDSFDSGDQEELMVEAGRKNFAAYLGEGKYCFPIGDEMARIYVYDFNEIPQVFHPHNLTQLDLIDKVNSVWSTLKQKELFQQQ